MSTNRKGLHIRHWPLCSIETQRTSGRSSITKGVGVTTPALPSPSPGHKTVRQFVVEWESGIDLHSFVSKVWSNYKDYKSTQLGDMN